MNFSYFRFEISCKYIIPKIISLTASFSTSNRVSMAASWSATCTALGRPPTTAAYTPPTRRTVRTLHASELVTATLATCCCPPLEDDVRLLSLADGHYVRYFKHEARVCDMAVNYEIECFLSSAVDRSVRLWDYGMEKAAASSAFPCCRFTHSLLHKKLQ